MRGGTTGGWGWGWGDRIGCLRSESEPGEEGSRDSVAPLGGCGTDQNRFVLVFVLVLEASN